MLSALAESTQPKMLSERVGRLLVLYQSDEPPRDSEWDACLAQVRSFTGDLNDLRVLVLTRGGGPTPHQRKRLAKTIGRAMIRVAVVTDSVRVRFISSSVALFMARLRSFGWEDVRQAYFHLDLDARERRLADGIVADLGSAMSGQQ